MTPGDRTTLRALPASEHTIEHAGEVIPYSVIRSDRRTVAIQVYADGSVVVRAPRRMPAPDIIAFAASRGSWVFHHRQRLKQRPPSTPGRTYTPGETHRYLAEDYTLAVARGPRGGVRLDGSNIVVTLRGEITPERTRRALDAWSRDRARDLFSERLAICWLRFRAQVALSSDVMPTVRVKAMRSRWGSLSPHGAMSLNVHLLAAPLECIDYVIYHELCHLLVRGHGPEFYRALEAIVPDWRRWKKRLAEFSAR